MIKICDPWCGHCSADHECIKFQTCRYDKLTMPCLASFLGKVLKRLRIQLDSEDCAAQGWQYLALESGLYDA